MKNITKLFNFGVNRQVELTNLQNSGLINQIVNNNGSYQKYFDRENSIYQKVQNSFAFQGVQIGEQKQEGKEEQRKNYEKGGQNYQSYFNSHQIARNMLFSLPLFVIVNQKLNKLQCFFSKSPYQQDILDNRAVTLQYAANNPIEDRINLKQLQNIEGYLLEVYDGHGGWQVSQFVQKNFSTQLEQILKENKEKQWNSEEEYIKASLAQAFDEIEYKYLNMAKQAYSMGFPKVGRVGSCALITLVHKNKIYSANSGDCKGIIVSENHKGQFEGRKINHKQNANSPKEQQRLKQSFPNEPDIVVCQGKDACYVKSRLQPTRSFGDLDLKYAEFNNPNKEPTEKGFPKRVIENFKGPYITHKPEIKVFELNQQDRYLVMATDGLWDNLKKKDVVKVVETFSKDKVKIINQLFTNTINAAAQENQISVEQMKLIPIGTRRSYHDDISIIVVDLEKQFQN